MKLYELVYCCRLYGPFSGQDRRLNELRERVGASLDPWHPEHRTALFQWLNRWGCRQFARQHHSTTASESLVTWAESWLGKLPGPPTHLTDLSPSDLDLCADAYDALRISLASHRTLEDGRVTPVTYGPAGAAKTLFALRPNVFPPWDEEIRDRLHFSKDRTGFRRYLTDVVNTLRELSSEADLPIAALPQLVGRPNSSPPKLVDEYNWVFWTKRCRPPAPEELFRWTEWVQRAQASDARP
jgi:hypothetical protein